MSEGVAVEVAQVTVLSSAAHKTEALVLLYIKLRLLPLHVTCTWQGELLQVAVHCVVDGQGSDVLSAHNPKEHSETTSVSKTT